MIPDDALRFFELKRSPIHLNLSPTWGRGGLNGGGSDLTNNQTVNVDECG